MRNTGYTAYQLRELQDRGVIASVFTDPENPDDFIAGYVRGINARGVLVESITPYGRFDGWFAIRLQTIVEVMYDATYAGRLELLISIHNEKPGAAFNFHEEDYVVALLKYAIDHNRAVTIWTATEAYTGFVSAIDDLRVTIESLDFMGERFGSSQVRITDVELLSLGSEEERMNEALSDHAQKKHQK